MNLKPGGGGFAHTRRELLVIVNFGFAGLSALLVGIPVIGFLFAPLFEKTAREWRSVGPIDRFPAGQTVEVSFEDASPQPWAGVSAETGAWLQRSSATEFVAFSLNCSHLGCPVRWRADAKLFMCPCHGGIYYSNGSVAAGPPPRGLTRYPVRIRDGNVEILTSPIPVT